MHQENIMSECAIVLKDAVGEGQITEAQAEDLVKRMRNRAKARAELRGGNAFEKLGEIAGEMAMESDLDLKLRERNSLLNLSKRAQAQNRVDAAVARGMDAADAILSIETGTVKRLPGGLSSADIKAHLLKKRAGTSLIAEAQKLGIWQELRTGKLDNEIVAAWDNPDAARPEIKAFLKKWDDVMTELVGMENRAGGNIGFLEDWRVTQSWDSGRVRLLGVKAGGPAFYRAFKKPDMKLAEERFIELMLPRLDAERTFRGVDPREYLSNVFRNFFYDNHNVPGEFDPLNPAVKVHGGLANRISQPRLLHFKSAADWHAVHQAIGKQATMSDLMLGNINRHSHNIALLDAWGPGGKANRDAFIESEGVRLRESGAPVAAADSLRSPVLEASWNVISGATTFSTRPMLSKIVDGIKVWTRFSTMGGSGLTAFITDKAFMQSALRRIGMPRFEAAAALTRFSMPRTAEEKAFARMYLTGIEGSINSIATRFDNDIQLGKLMARADYHFWRWNLLEQVTFSHRAAAAEAMSHFAASHADRAWGDLPADLRESFELSGLDENLWNIHRQFGVGETTRGRFLTEEGFASIPDSVIDSLAEKRGIKATGANRKRLRDEIRDSWRGWMETELRFAVPEGTAREQVRWMGNLKRGSWQGEVWNMVGLLKTFPMAIVNTVAARDMYRGGAGRLTEAVFSMNRGYYDVAMTAAYAGILGYLQWTIKNALVGKGPPPLTDNEGNPNIDTYLGSLARGGGIGIIGDFTMQEFDGRFRHWSSAALGPILGQVDTGVAAFSQGIRGESIKPQVQKLIESNTPFINLFYLRWALNYSVLWSMREALNPGVLERQRSSFEDEGGRMNPLLPVFDPEKRWRTLE